MIVISVPGPIGFFKVFDAVAVHGVRQTFFAADVTRRIEPHWNEFGQHKSRDGNHHFIIDAVLRGTCIRQNDGQESWLQKAL